MLIKISFHKNLVFFIPKSIYVSVLQIFFLFLYNVIFFSLLLSPTIRAKLSEIDEGWNEKKMKKDVNMNIIIMDKKIFFNCPLPYLFFF